MRRAAALACCCFGWLGTANGGFVDPASVTSEHFFDEAVNAQDLFYAWRSLGHQLLLSDALPEGSTLAGALRLAGTDEPFPQEVFFATHDEDAVRDVLFHTLSSPAFQRLRDNAKRHSMERWAEPSDAVVDAVVALGADGDDSVGIDLLCALAGMHNSSADAAEASLEISIRLFTSPTFEAGFNAVPRRFRMARSPSTSRRPGAHTRHGAGVFSGRHQIRYASRHTRRGRAHGPRCRV